jgi:hypothetical protein
MSFWRPPLCCELNVNWLSSLIPSHPDLVAKSFIVSLFGYLRSMAGQ